MNPLPEDQIMVQRIDDNHVAVSAYEHLGYRHWVKVALSDPPKFLTGVENAERVSVDHIDGGAVIEH